MILNSFKYLLVAIFIGITSIKAQSQQPNIIIFFTDDQGFGDLGCYGAKGFETPNADNLASEGIRFTNFYVPATVCTPSRAGILTGRYPKRSGLHEAVLFPFSENGLPLQEYTMAELLKDAGYETWCVGKWHLGHKEEFMPNNQGFDDFFGVPYSNDMDNYYYARSDFQAPPLPLYRNKVLVEHGPNQEFLTTRYTEESIHKIKNRDPNKPFLLYLAHNMPHVPLHVSPKFKGKSTLGLYGDVIMELDWSIGEIVNTLKAEGIYDNTIFILTSDNGPDLGSAGPLRGKKAQTWEGGQRVPGIVVWPKKIPKNEECKEPLSTLDLFPTLARFAGAHIPDNLILDGKDVGALWLNPKTEKLKARPFFYYARNGGLEAVRYGKWKLHIKKSMGWDQIKLGDFELALYNLENDISELNNVAEKHPGLVKKLKSLINEHAI
ncbi:sulfatase [Aestuariibaculum sp. TT11]|uniref:Sulfatase n=2 Tax=Aestuariibaculum sediminum TaxID=2770637 RepID=A0A8J6PZ54_9FLAO|nr:sulfatase [Aestuariibaculum sediminum]